MAQQTVSGWGQDFACAVCGIIAGLKHENGELRKADTQRKRSGAACGAAADYRYVKALRHQSTLTA
jgi:hypothetical protein